MVSLSNQQPTIWTLHFLTVCLLDGEWMGNCCWKWTDYAITYNLFSSHVYGVPYNSIQLCTIVIQVRWTLYNWITGTHTGYTTGYRRIRCQERNWRGNNSTHQYHTNTNWSDIQNRARWIWMNGQINRYLTTRCIGWIKQTDEPQLLNNVVTLDDTTFNVYKF